MRSASCGEGGDGLVVVGREARGEGLRGAHAEDESIVEIPDVVDAIGDEVHGFEHVVQRPDEGLASGLWGLLVADDLGDRLGVFAERTQPLGE
ncbi:MAG: hypothetical protein V9G19_27865 [Tetrasphaera sp.]